MGKYDSILHSPAHKSRVHPAMKNQDRAKQFMPFAPLKTFDSAIEETRVLYTAKRILSEEEKEDVGRKLEILSECRMQGQMPAVCVEIFEKVDPGFREVQGEIGLYRVIRGPVRRIAPAEQKMLVGEEKISFEQICSIWQEDGESVFMEI